MKNVFYGIFLLMILSFSFGCASESTTNKQTDDTTKNTETAQTGTLDDLQTTACQNADSVGTCDTKLEDLGIVTQDQCCRYLGKCC